MRRVIGETHAQHPLIRNPFIRNPFIRNPFIRNPAASRDHTDPMHPRRRLIVETQFAVSTAVV